MNDERGYFSHPNSFDPTQVRRAWELRAPNDGTPAVGLSVLIGADVQTPLGWLERIFGLAGASTVHTVQDLATLADLCSDLEPDLILLDTSSTRPGLLTELRKRLPDQGFLPIVVSEADPTLLNRARALDAGATDVVTRPFNDVELVQRMSNLLTMRALYLHVQQCNHVQRCGHDTLA